MKERLDKKLLKRLKDMGCKCAKISDIEESGSLVTFKCGGCKIGMRRKEFIQFVEQELNDNKENEDNKDD